MNTQGYSAAIFVALHAAQNPPEVSKTAGIKSTADGVSFYFRDILDRLIRHLLVYFLGFNYNPAFRKKRNCNREKLGRVPKMMTKITESYFPENNTT